MPSTADVLALEVVAYDLWRAPEVEELDGWRLRFAHGLTGRANSVWPCGDGALPLDEKIDLVEEWYRSRRSPVLVQITNAARPVELDTVLARRGYRLRSAPVSVQVAALDEVLERTSGDAEVTEQLIEDWVARWAGSRGSERVDVARALLAAGRSAFASVDDTAVGRGVAVGDWLGITAMATLPEARRRGYGRAILHALAVWGASQGCVRALLQVEHGNRPAEALYASAGFVAHHDYHYRLLDPRSSALYSPPSSLRR
jgi:GNAT superfamily N-acetyltransferase